VITMVPVLLELTALPHLSGHVAAMRIPGIRTAHIPFRDAMDQPHGAPRDVYGASDRRAERLAKTAKI
jgi:hypothetical protein